jgi:hypothetical protein
MVSKSRVIAITLLYSTYLTHCFGFTRIIISLQHDLERGGDLEAITHTYVIKTPTLRKEENLFAFSVVNINLVL